jgi:alanyl-tRNA synthetase
MFTKGTDRSTYIQGVPPTQFVGREELVLHDPQLLKDFSVEQKRVLIFDKTPFYAESGGQKADTGTIQLDDGTTVRVLDVQKYEGVFLHFVE